MSARIAIVTCAELPELDPDDRLLPPALAALGIEPEIVSWDDPGADWPAYELVAVRNTWDYAARRDEFLAWARTVERIVNPAEVLEWTTDKRYMAELEADGLPVVHTQFLDTPGAQLETGPHGVVVKPAIGAGSVDAGRHTDPAEAAAHVEQIVASGRTAMVQPFLPGIGERGETALMYLGGAYSHAIHKGPMLPETGIVRPDGLFQPESIVARAPTAQERAVRDEVMAWVERRFGTLAYARIDVVPGAGGTPLVLECELSEPSLFLGTSGGAADRLARSLLDKIGDVCADKPK